MNDKLKNVAKNVIEEIKSFVVMMKFVENEGNEEYVDYFTNDFDFIKFVEENFLIGKVVNVVVDEDKNFIGFIIEGRCEKKYEYWIITYVNEIIVRDLENGEKIVCDIDDKEVNEFLKMFEEYFRSWYGW